MKKIIAGVFLLTGIIIFSVGFSPCFSQGQVQLVQPQVFKGQIINVDFLNSKITVKYLQPNGDNDEITLGVGQHTKINQGDLRISLSNLKEGDQVAVEYYDDPMSFEVLEARRINLSY